MDDKGLEVGQRVLSLTLDGQPGEAKQRRGPGLLPAAQGSPGAETIKEPEETFMYRQGWWRPQAGNGDFLTKKKKKNNRLQQQCPTPQM